MPSTDVNFIHILPHLIQHAFEETHDYSQFKEDETEEERS